MKYDTAGNQIIEPIQNCDCGLTGGCEKCNPYSPTNQLKVNKFMEEIDQIKQELAETYEVVKERDDTIADLHDQIDELRQAMDEIYAIAKKF